jgi:hypothetical protein
MLKKKIISGIWFLLAGFSLLLVSCESNLTGVEDSPEPGVVRITIQSDPSDTYLVERTDTFSIFTPFGKVFNINTFQGSVFSGEKFAVLFRSTQSYRQEDSVYNVIEVNVPDEELRAIGERIANGELDINTLSVEYKKFILFESYVPPGDYDKIRVGINAPRDIEQNRIVLTALSGKQFSIPLQLPPADSLLVSFPVNFKVSSGQVTEINLRISPFKSVYRYRDAYRFDRKIEVTGVQYF